MAGQRPWTPDAVRAEFADARLVARNSSAQPVEVPAELADLAAADDRPWELTVATTYGPDRAEVVRAWWRAITHPGRPEPALLRTHHDDGTWSAEEVTILDVSEEMGVLLAARRDLGPCEEPPPVRAPDPHDFDTDQAIYHRPTWIFQEMDPLGVVLSTEGDVEQVFGRPAEELVGNLVLTYLHPDDHPAIVDMWSALLVERRGTRHIRQRVLRPDGSHLWVETTVISRLDAEGDGVVVAVSHDITERRSRERDLRTMALVDTLTGLPNRASLIAELDTLLQQGPATVAFLDLDNFKDINDRHGHHAGDEALAALALRLRAGLPPHGVVGRWGGDEFVLLAPGKAESRLTHAITRAFADTVALESGTWVPRGSWGTVVGEPGEDPEAVVRSADSAMYEAKSRPERP